MLHVITVTDKDADVQSTVYYVFFVIWILSALISSCYTFAWDIKMDWGFFEKGRIIREETIYYYKVSLSLSLSLSYPSPLLLWLLTIGLLYNGYNRGLTIKVGVDINNISW